MEISCILGKRYRKTENHKQRIIDYLNDNRDLPVIQKILNVEQLERNDIAELERIVWKELGTKEEYEQYVESGHLLCGDRVAVFIRSIIGIDHQKALAKYSEFLSDVVLNSEQEEFLKTVIDYVSNAGDITPEVLVNDDTFADTEWMSIFGQDVICLKKYIETLHKTIIA